MTDKPSRPRAKYGFAGMDPEKRREIARKGGAAKKTRAFQDPALAARAGRLGGIASGQARAAKRLAPKKVPTE